MKKISSVISVSTCIAAALAAVPFQASAADDVIYGTMNIPYADFYAAEFGTSSNAYEVDAVSSATTDKWSKNGEGELFEGSYASEANEDGTGSILGVVYPVAISQADLDALGDNNYNFTALSEAPAAYKEVSVSDGKAAFSEVKDTTPTALTDASIKLSTSTPWGDYLISVNNGTENVINGALVKTADGNTYAFRHEQNIWRGQFAWSSGITTTEPHGNTLDYENYVGLMGSTITELVYITKEGYETVSTNTYVPVKFEYTLNVENGKSGTGSTSYTSSGIPSDFTQQPSVGDGFTVSGSTISYTDAKPGSYTLTISDGSGKYADLSASFTLSTSDVPVKYDGEKLVPADGFTQDDADNFIKNLSKVSVNDKSYNASGKGAVAVINSDGTVNTAVEAGGGRSAAGTPVFAEAGEYKLVLTSTGYDNTYEFTIDTSEQTTTSTSATTTVNGTTTTKAAGATTTKKGTDSPKTGVDGAAVPAAALALATAAAFALRKKND